MVLVISDPQLTEKFQRVNIIPVHGYAGFAFKKVGCCIQIRLLVYTSIIRLLHNAIMARFYVSLSRFRNRDRIFIFCIFMGLSSLEMLVV